MLELWIMVVGGESEDERIVCSGNLEEIEAAIQKYEYEVITDFDKSFSLCTPVSEYVFHSYEEFNKHFLPHIAY